MHVEVGEPDSIRRQDRPQPYYEYEKIERKVLETQAGTEPQVVDIGCRLQQENEKQALEEQSFHRNAGTGRFSAGQSKLWFRATGIRSVAATGKPRRRLSTLTQAKSARERKIRARPTRTTIGPRSSGLQPRRQFLGRMCERHHRH